MEQDEELSWMTKPLHGRNHRQKKEVLDIKKSYSELEKATSKDLAQVTDCAKMPREIPNTL